MDNEFMKKNAIIKGTEARMNYKYAWQTVVYMVSEENSTTDIFEHISAVFGTTIEEVDVMIDQAKMDAESGIFGRQYAE